MNSTLRHIIIIIAMAFAMTALQGCHSTKSAVSTTISDDTEAELFARLISGYKDWNDIYMPVTLSVSSPVDVSISGRATFISDSEIYISLRMIGIEVAVVYINNEKLFIIDKFHKIYMEESLDRLPGDIPVNISNLQDMLIGRVFLPGHTTLTLSDASGFKLSNSTPTTWTLTPVTRIKGADWHFNASRTTPPVLTGISVLASRTPIECVYSDPKNTVAGQLASALDISAPVGAKNINVSIQWGLDDAKWDSGRTVKFSAPGNSYKKVTLDSLIKSLKFN